MNLEKLLFMSNQVLRVAILVCNRYIFTIIGVSIIHKMKIVSKGDIMSKIALSVKIYILVIGLKKTSIRSTFNKEIEIK